MMLRRWRAALRPAGALQASPSAPGWRRSRENPLPQGWHLGGMVEPSSCAVEEPPAPRAHGDPSLIPVVSPDLSAWAISNRNLRRVLAHAAADHLHEAAELLREAQTLDTLLLGAARTSEVIGALDLGARRFGGALPADLVASAAQLRAWGVTLKQQVTARTADRERADRPADLVRWRRP